jgi:NADPH:quinone reductase-like Zn-dependent oxidoreductase
MTSDLSTAGTAASPVPAQATMRAVRHDRYGDAADVLRLAQVPQPRMGDGDVLVRVRAAAVDRGVWHVVTGLPYPIRLAGYGLRAPKAPVPGMDVAGEVLAVGAHVSRLQVGDEVFGTANGSFAEYARAPQSTLAVKPARLTWEQAAAVPSSGVAALQGLRDRGQLEPGQEVLIIGASGGVGTFAVQVAKALGARVTGICSTPKVELVRSLGADDVVDYTACSLGELADAGRRYDVVLDTGGHASLRSLRRLLTRRGRLVIVGSETGGRWLGGTDRQLRAIVLSPFLRQTLVTFMSSAQLSDLEALAQLIDQGDLTPVVDRSFELAEVPAAIGHLLAGRVRGKVVIRV